MKMEDVTEPITKKKNMVVVEREKHRGSVPVVDRMAICS
jgi:hypothetical protein